ncbi:UbiA prenyltransferase [Gluconacetobacter diazotrophicus PA1 5]|uniref:UbiA family prenyltransferase n=1 Tax=Gluconacetobacter diazotrophicus TaxID=33996 RepID=A0A7W4FDG8_GLUDI|nr:UbiA family prenyltransferase [Gluconacetobacter diazotrophicus]ACI50547.1 UbiA prenyltransferase [Gluconacetobacter diazotrophicus PA1 5]MBB2155740.1 UbiA family prenyltransferase [Gluconacetobacter diazotrophicus]TWB09379.1 4-hydroxybenzoate polyprenyltransferase [Gluconacetobacter diazotrophicus]
MDSSLLLDHDTQYPLVVDLDGTLIASDLLIESFFACIGQEFASLPHLCSSLAKGKAHLKHALASRVEIDAMTLPYQDAVLDLIDQARAQGRPIFLATASNERYARAVTQHLGGFDGIFASDTHNNLSGANKARVLVEAFGEKGFDYVGNHRDDLEIWRHARRCHAIGLDGGSRRKLHASGPDRVEILDKPPQSLKTWARALRVHQYAKNVLVFLPALAAHAFSLTVLLQSCAAFLAFCASASAIYLVNDLVDLRDDRSHPTKKRRPLASGRVSIHAALAAIPILGLCAIALCLFLPLIFSVTLFGYVVLTTGYSFWLKRKKLGDVVGLALLYTARLVGGAAATGIVLSEWILAFSLFVFTSLALIKRYTELLTRLDANLPDSSSRDYKKDDLVVLASLAAASGTNAVTVFSLYIASDSVKATYRHPDMLWLLSPILLFLLGRVLIVAHRRHMHDDPVIWALRDRTSCVAVACSIMIFLAAS